MFSMNLIKIIIGFAVAIVIALFTVAVSKIMVQPDEISTHAVYLDVDVASISKKSSGPDDISELIATADISYGKKKARACISCHSFNEGGKNSTGPNLWGIFNSNKASNPNFSYSSAMKEFGGTWDEDALNKFMYKPKSYIKGTKMTYAGLKKNKDRAAIIAYLKSLSN